MIYMAYYVIYPTHHLGERVEHETENLRLFVQTPRLWIKEQGGRTAWGAEDYEEHAKLLFLADLLTSAEEDAPRQCLLDELLGTPPYTTAPFDRWWHVFWLVRTRDELFEEAERRADGQALRLLGTPQSAVVKAGLMDLIATKYAQD